MMEREFSYVDAMVYLSDEAKQPLQLVLRAILIQNQPQSGMIADIQSIAWRIIKVCDHYYFIPAIDCDMSILPKVF